MRRKLISSATLFSIALSTILGLSAIYSGVGIAKADSVIATIPVGSIPRAIAFDSANGDLYVANAGANTVSVISGQTNTVIGNPIHVGLSPLGIAFDSANGDLYVTNFNSHTVSVISGQTNTVLGSSIFVGPTPFTIAFDSANGNLYIANELDNSLSVLSGQTNTVLGRIPIVAGVESGPLGIAFDSINGNLYVANSDDSTVSVISGQTNTVIANPIPVGLSPRAIAFDSANGNLYVTNEAANTVSVISGQTNTVLGSPIPVGSTPFGIAFDPANFNLFVANQNDNTVSVVSTTTNQPIPPDTTITSAVEGNGAMIQNGGTTLSTSIQFIFTATQGSNPIASFQCSLDNSPFYSCTSPAVLNNLAAGPHKFAVVAVDTLGNRDPTPASFGWTILTPAQGIQQLIQLIQSIGLNHGTQTSLTAPLNAALSQLTNNNPNSVGTACNQLNGFINHVDAGPQNGRLSSSQASQLIQSTRAITTALHC